MKKYLRPWLMSGWMGIALLVFAKLTFMQWEFYAIMLPTVFIAVVVYQD